MKYLKLYNEKIISSEDIDKLPIEGEILDISMQLVKKFGIIERQELHDLYESETLEVTDIWKELEYDYKIEIVTNEYLYAKQYDNETFNYPGQQFNWEPKSVIEIALMYIPGYPKLTGKPYARRIQDIEECIERSKSFMKHKNRYETQGYLPFSQRRQLEPFRYMFISNHNYEYYKIWKDLLVISFFDTSEYNLTERKLEIANYLDIEFRQKARELGYGVLSSTPLASTGSYDFRIEFFKLKPSFGIIYSRH